MADCGACRGTGSFSPSSGGAILDFCNCHEPCGKQNARNGGTTKYLDVHHGRVKYKGLYVRLLLESILGVFISALALTQSCAIDEPTHHVEFTPMYLIGVFFIEIWVPFMCANEIGHMDLSVGNKLVDV